MSRKRKSRSGAKHVRFYRWELNSPAFLSLSCTARCLLLELKYLYNGENNGDLFLSCREAAKILYVSKDTASRAFQELEDHGFIRPKTKGAYTLKQRHATSWVLTEYAVGNALPAMTFMKWKPPAEIHLPVRYEGQAVSPQGQIGQQSSPNTPHLSHHRDRFGPNDPSDCPPGDTHIVYQAGDQQRAHPANGSPAGLLPWSEPSYTEILTFDPVAPRRVGTKSKKTTPAKNLGAAKSRISAGGAALPARKEPS